jgi:hypothetical protein
MTPAKIRENEPTVEKEIQVTRILGKQEHQTEDAREKVRRSGMTKGTAGATETGDENEQGAAGTNK